MCQTLSLNLECVTQDLQDAKLELSQLRRVVNSVRKNNHRLTQLLEEQKRVTAGFHEKSKQWAAIHALLNQFFLELPDTEKPDKNATLEEKVQCLLSRCRDLGNSRLCVDQETQEVIQENHLILKKATRYRDRIRALSQERDQLRAVLLHQEAEIRKLRHRRFLPSSPVLFV